MLRILPSQLRQRKFVFLLVAVSAALGVPADVPAAETLDARLRPLIEAHNGDVAVAVKHLETGETFYYRENEPMPTASLIKFPVMVEAYRQAEVGKNDLAALVTLGEDDKVQGSGILTTHFSPGIKLSVRDAIRLMIAYSDNTATNLVLDQIGLAATSETMTAWGYPHTKIHAKVYRRDTSIFPERSRQFGLGSTTAAETVRLYEQLYRRELVSEAACEEMLGHLYKCESSERIARFLPRGTKLAHKGGSVSAVRTDAGLMESPAGPIALCILTSNNADRRWHTDNAGNRLCADVGRAVYDYFNPPSTVEQPAEPTEPAQLEIGASGRLVEALQRTLNARLTPSPDLAVDGDFGPATEAAVVRFQESRELAANGVVGPQTWNAISPLLLTAQAVPDPEVVNSEELETAPADPLTGPPFVTCKAWAVADGKTGQVLWGQAEDTRLSFASTTKMMTAYLVVQLADADATVLDEQVVFSKRADDTPGSTAGIKAGETLTVGELLYGLMLPSGNDASVALAEHFGNRFDPPAGEETDDPLDRFVAEMNRTAARLEMHETTYKNTHGLTARGHLSSARDLVRLAWTAMQSPLFRQYVQTRQYGCRVTSPSGYTRNVVWKNTNQLLGIEGYWGVKTGTTTAAGACLVSRGRRGEDDLIVVVLGSSSSPARYTDSRNLYRWAWLQRGHTK